MIKQYGIFHSHASFVFVQVYEEESIATENGATPEPRPFFEDPDSNITVQLAAPVHLHCRVENLQERTVSTVCIETFREFQSIEEWIFKTPTSRTQGLVLNRFDICIGV